MEQLLNLLRQLIADSGDRERRIMEFSDIADEMLTRGLIPTHQIDAVTNLIQDLAFYVQAADERREDSSYYGDAELERRIQDSLQHLES